MLYKLNSMQYSNLISVANAHDSGCVYPLSVAEGIQEGDIFTSLIGNYNQVLFWTQSGFAYLSGTIVPSLFWINIKDFLAKGKGYCISCGDDIATWAFSAAVSSKEIDIGVETNPKYQQQGLGKIVAKKMIQYTIEQSKKPVWACHYKNDASAKMAEKLGFIKMSECSVIKKK